LSNAFNNSAPYAPRSSSLLESESISFARLGFKFFLRLLLKGDLGWIETALK
jgi:hypothetical protein